MYAHIDDGTYVEDEDEEPPQLPTLPILGPELEDELGHPAGSSTGSPPSVRGVLSPAIVM